MAAKADDVLHEPRAQYTPSPFAMAAKVSLRQSAEAMSIHLVLLPWSQRLGGSFLPGDGLRSRLRGVCEEGRERHGKIAGRPAGPLVGGCSVSG